MQKNSKLCLCFLSSIGSLLVFICPIFQLPNNVFASSTFMIQSVSTKQPLEVSCSTNQNADNEVILDLQIQNVSNKTVHILDGRFMPYRILQDDGSLLILQGVTPPDPRIRYFAIEIPPSRPVAPEEIVSYQVKLKPLYLEDHYDYQSKPTDLQGLVKVRCQVAWNEEPVSDKIRAINTLLDWQNLTSPTTIEVKMA